MRLLQESGFDVAAQVGDAEALHYAVIREHPDVAIVDVRMPPTQTDEGTRAAKQIRDRHPEMSLLVLSQIVQAKHALELFSERPEGLGYFVSPKTVETHVSGIFTKLGLAPAADDHRRVLAVLAYLGS